MSIIHHHQQKKNVTESRQPPPKLNSIERKGRSLNAPLPPSIPGNELNLIPRKRQCCGTITIHVDGTGIKQHFGPNLNYHDNDFIFGRQCTAFASLSLPLPNSIVVGYPPRYQQSNRFITHTHQRQQQSIEH